MSILSNRQSELIYLPQKVPESYPVIFLPALPLILINPGFKMARAEASFASVIADWRLGVSPHLCIARLFYLASSLDCKTLDVACGVRASRLDPG